MSDQVPVPAIQAGLRTAETGDLDALRAIARDALRFDDDAADLLDMLWNSPTSAPALRIVAEVAGQVVGFACGSIRTVTSRDGHTDIIAVAPEFHGQGIGRQVLAEIETRLRAQRVERLLIGGNTPQFAWPGMDVRYTLATCMASAAGYHQARQAMNMTVDLATAPLDTADDISRLAIDGIEIRRSRPDDADALDACARAFGGTWDLEVARAAAHAPSGVHVAARADRIVGFACHGVNRRTWFGPMATDESERGRGIGSVLLRACLADLRDDGFASGDIGWVGPYRFYARSVAARISQVYWIYEKAA